MRVIEAINFTTESLLLFQKRLLESAHFILDIKLPWWNAVMSAIFKKKWYTVLEIQFRFVKCTIVTRIHKNFEQLFISVQVIKGDYSVLM